MASIVIRGGQVVWTSGEFAADVVIDGEKIMSLVDPGTGTGDREIDAHGCYVLPGGIDTHTHLENPALHFTTQSSDDFHTGTLAAAAGGTTTIVDFVKSRPEDTIYEAFQARRAVAEEKVVVDFGLHPMVPSNALEVGAIDDLRRLAEEGATSWKFFMAYQGMMVDDATLIAGFRAASEEGVMPMVHAENGHLVQDATDRLVAAGMVEEHHHLAAHTHTSEQEAVHRAIAIAESVGSALFVVHVSSRFAAAEIQAARARALPVHGETCPQYLLAAYEDYEGLGHEAAKYLCSPPIRERANQESLWEALVSDTLSTIGTDHAAFCMGQPDDLPPQKGRGLGYFPDVPNGVPGIEDRLSLIWQAGVRQGRFDVCRFVDLVATRPAKLFGLHPQKGAVVPGADADVIVWDPEQRRTVRAADHHMRTDYNLYEGTELVGGPTHVISRGELIVEHGEIAADRGRGRYLARRRPLPKRSPGS
ncbi:MAG: dihydropyrimidinase [Acidimicrobiales bacterium]